MGEGGGSLADLHKFPSGQLQVPLHLSVFQQLLASIFGQLGAVFRDEYTLASGDHREARTNNRL